MKGMFAKMLAKRILIFLCAIVCLFTVGATAYADEPLDVLCALTPADFTEPGASKLSVTLHNASAKPIINVRISQDPNKEGAAVGDIEPGESVHFSHDVQVSKKMLDAGKVTVTITYKLGNKTQKMQAFAKVMRVENVASATLTARIFKTALYSGESTQVEYRLFNTGAIAIEEAFVFDPAFQYTSPAVTLAPGEEKMFWTTAVFSESAISSPRLNFLSSESKTPYVIHAASTAINVVQDNLSFAIEPDTVSVNYGGRAHFSIAIKNSGLLTYSDISVNGENLGVFPIANATLAPGDTITMQVETPTVTLSAVYPIRVSMREAGGSERTFHAGEMNISVSESAPRNPLMYVTSNAHGNAPFTFVISGANRNIKNAVLSEKTLGEIKTFLVISAASETTFSPILHVNKGEAFEFVLTWEENGETFSVSAAPVISQITPQPDAENSLTNAAHASLYAMVKATHLPKIVLIASLSLLALAIVFLILYKFAQIKKRRRLAHDALGKTSKFAPIRTKDPDKENP